MGYRKYRSSVAANFFQPIGNTESPGATEVTVIEKDSSDNVLRATGTSVPGTEAGYAKGALFIKTDAGAGVKSVYENIGTTSASSFNLIGDVSASEITLAEGSVLVGNGSGVAVALDLSTDTEIAVGNGTTATAVSLSGDVTMTNAGVVSLDVTLVQYVSVDITEATIVGMNGAAVTVLAGQGADTAIEFISAVMVYDFDTASYTGGGDVTLEYTGGSTVSTTLSAAESFGAAGDKVTGFQNVSTAGGDTLPVNTGLDITNASAAFVDPGTAAGVGRLKIAYRVHTLGL